MHVNEEHGDKFEKASVNLINQVRFDFASVDAFSRFATMMAKKMEPSARDSSYSKDRPTQSRRFM